MIGKALEITVHLGEYAAHEDREHRALTCAGWTWSERESQHRRWKWHRWLLLTQHLPNFGTESGIGVETVIGEQSSRRKRLSRAEPFLAEFELAQRPMKLLLTLGTRHYNNLAFRTWIPSFSDSGYFPRLWYVAATFAMALIVFGYSTYAHPLLSTLIWSILYVPGLVWIPKNSLKMLHKTIHKTVGLLWR